ncbi:MAG: hypothetical protein Q8N16_02130 [bacterium]|nr:hypothetical protein [bacterium]
MDNKFAGFAALVNALSPQTMPDGDAQDIANGAAYIPGEVTDLRRAGQTVSFAKTDGPRTEWYWTMPGGTTIKHG